MDALDRDEPPARLIDHSKPGVADRFDAIELVSADGSSDYFSHVGMTNTFESPPGDSSVLARSASGFLLTDAGGSLYEFGAADATTGVAALKKGETTSAKAGAARLEYVYDPSSGKVQSLTAYGKNNAGTTEFQLGKLSFNWSCANALVCIEGPDEPGIGTNLIWKYVGDGNGRIYQVHNGVRTLLEIGYGANGKPSSLKNANDLNPAAASPGYLSGHALSIAYDGSNRVQSMSDAVRNRYYSPSSPTAIWTLSYLAAASCTSPALPLPRFAGHTGTQPPLRGCTDLVPPRFQGTSKKIRVFYDNLAHPLGSVDSLGRTPLSVYNERDQLVWGEDADGRATDNVYDVFDFSLTKSSGPDPDGDAGPQLRPETLYRYDETMAGSGSAAGASLTGLRAAYFATADLSGRPAKVQTDATVDFSTSVWGAGGPAALAPRVDDFSVRWSGVLEISTSGAYVLATDADDGTRLTIDGQVAVDNWTGQILGTPICSQPLTLSAGRHRIVLEYRELNGTAAVQLKLGTSCATASVIAGSSLKPGYRNQTSAVSPPNSAAGQARVSFSHFAEPQTGLPDYTLVKVGAENLITSFEYDSFGRITKKWMPKGNVARAIETAGPLVGTLTGTPTGPYSTTWTYYEAGAAPVAPASCAGSAANQRGLTQALIPAGVATTTNVYGVRTDLVSVTNNAGATCRNYDMEGRLTSERAPGETQDTTYSYDPAGQLRSQSDASGAITSVYNEAGALIDTVDSYGAEMELVYDPEGNVTTRRVATGSFATSTIYASSYVYDDENQLTQLSDPAGRQWSFYWDNRGNLKATQYPNGTFSWQSFNEGGWLTEQFNRHGTLTTPLPSVAPADTGPGALADFSYAYFTNGQRSNETRSGQGITTPESTNYGYDTLGRLATTAGAIERRYCYDLDSNRTEQHSSSTASCGAAPAASYSYPTSLGIDQLGSITQAGATTSYSYTADGQVNQRNLDTLNWDGRGRHSGGNFPGVAGVQFKLDGANLGSEDTSAPYSFNWDSAAASEGAHTLTAVARDRAGNQTASAPINVTVTPPPPPAPLVGNAQLEPQPDFAPAGEAEAFKVTAASAGTVSSLKLYLDSSSTASQVLIGLYADNADHPGARLAQATISSPTAGAWNTVAVPSLAVAAGTSYWIAVLNPPGTGTMKFRDRCCGSGASAAEGSSSTSLTALPATWTSGSYRSNDGPLSAYGDAGGSPPGGGGGGGGSALLGNSQVEPAIDITPAGEAEAFKTTAAAAGTVSSLKLYLDAGSTATQALVALYADASDHPGTRLTQGTISSPVAGAWNTVSLPTVSVTAGTSYWIAVLNPPGTGTMKFRDRCCGSGASAAEGSSSTSLTALPATWTSGGFRSNDGPISAYAEGASQPQLALSTQTLTFSSAVGTSPPTQQLAISNGGGGLLNWTATSSDSWLTAAPASGVGTATVNITASANSLLPGSYTGRITVSAAGATGSPTTVNVTLTVPTPGDSTPPTITITAPSSGPVSGTVTLAATAADNNSSTLSYGFDAAGFRRSRTLNGTTTRYLLGGLIETASTGTITSFDVDAPSGDLAHYGGGPTIGGAPPTYLYYSGHGDLTAEANNAGTRTGSFRYDAFGTLLTAAGVGEATERFTGRWDKKLDTTSGLVEMGVRPYDPVLGRFMTVDPIEGGSCNTYDYACQDPVNAYDLDGREHGKDYCEGLELVFAGRGCAQRSSQFRKYREERGSSRKLAKNLGERPSGAHAHHIVAWADKRASDARDILAHFRIPINSASNGVYLRAAVHRSVHTNEYYRSLTNSLRTAKSRDDVLTILDSYSRSLKLLGRPH